MKRGDFVSIEFSGRLIEENSTFVKVQITDAYGIATDWNVPVGSVMLCSDADRQSKAGGP